METNMHKHQGVEAKKMGDGSFVAVCPCGYRGRPFDNKADADRDADEHAICMMRAGE